MRIVVIENDALVAMTMEDTLKEAGHSVVGLVGTAQIAIKIILETRPDLLLVDFKLANGSTGAVVIDAIRAYASIPALFVSGSSEDCRRLGFAYAYGCLRKPFSGIQLLQAVEAVSLIAAGRPPGTMPSNLELYDPTHV